MTPQTDNHLSARNARGAVAAASPLAVAIVLLAASPVQAAGVAAFRLPAEPLDAALVRFAVQAGVSVGGWPAAGCGGTSRAVSGTMSAEQALAAMLPPGCSYQRLDARSFRIIGRPPPAAAPSPGPRPAAPPETARLDEVVVTAEKRAQSLVRSASAISVATGDDVRAMGGRTFDALAPQMVSVAVTNLGPGRDKIFVRGLSDGAFTGKTQSTVGLYLDDVPITYNAPDPDLRLVDIDRVEVLRGPQGTLYGSGSMGGIVHIVTAKPDPGRAAGAFTMEGMITQHGDPSASVNGMLNVPLAGGQAAVRAVGYTQYTGGYIDNPELGLRDINSVRRWGARLAALAELPGDWTLSGGYAHQSIDTADAQYTQGTDGPLSRDAAVREPHDNDFSEFSATAAHAGDFANVKVSTAYIDHDLKTRYDATGAFRAAGASPIGAAFDEDKRIRLWATEALATSTRASPLTWLAGAFVSYSNEMDAAALTGVRPPQAPRSIYRRRDRLSEAAIYGEATYDVTSRLSLTAGARWFVTRVSTEAGDFTLSQTPLEPVHSRLIDNGLLPKLRVTYAVTPDILVYAQMQKGYRAGGFNVPAAAGGSPMPEAAAARFSPDHLWSYEVGAGAPLFDNRLLLRAAVFHADWIGLQTDQRLASGLPLTVNIGDGSNTGLEAEAVWRPNERLLVRANLLLEDPQITRAANVFPARRDIGLPGVPFDMGGAFVRYRWPVGQELDAEVTGQLSYVGRSYLTFDGGTANRQGGYASGRVGASLLSRHWRATVWIDNVADEAGNTFAFGNPFSRQRFTQATPLRPRTAGFGITRLF
jgi:outer membrane receptor protein involved in Fe transport